MRTTIAMLGRIEETDVPPELRDRLLAAFRDRGRTGAPAFRGPLDRGLPRTNRQRPCWSS
jgi:hypothetical protein